MTPTQIPRIFPVLFFLLNDFSSQWDISFKNLYLRDNLYIKNVLIKIDKNFFSQIWLIFTISQRKGFGGGSIH